MSEFVRRSRKNETNTPDFGLEKLEKPEGEQLLEFFEPKVEDNRPEKIADTLPRLPWQLERLLNAASSDLLPKDTTTLGDGLVTDLNRYTLAWGCTYLVGDRDEALRRLWQAHRAWRGVN